MALAPRMPLPSCLLDRSLSHDARDVDAPDGANLERSKIDVGLLALRDAREEGPPLSWQAFRY
jgi:hypothetical protein